jgi:hypothetical protein
MWKEMIRDYYWDKNLDQSKNWYYGPEKWDEGHKFDEPQKFILFGDASIIVGGAFTINLSGNMYDWYGGPLLSYYRYRINGNVTIPSGQTLTAYSAASILFEDGKKITAMDANPIKGFIVNGTSDRPVCFMSMGPEPQSKSFLHGMKVMGEFKLRNGGELKLY